MHLTRYGSDLDGSRAARPAAAADQLPGGGLHGRHTECRALDQLLEDVRAGQSRVLILRGEAGAGKSTLLEYLAARASESGCRVARAAGMPSETELAFAGLHQLCAPMMACAERLPEPQRDALRTAAGLAAGPPPDRFLVGQAVLGLLAGDAAQGQLPKGAETGPLICLVDDAQWLDRPSGQILGFAARRLAAGPVGLVFAARDRVPELAGLPEREVTGLPDHDARALLASALAGPLDARVADVIIAETRGNPRALLELSRGLPRAQLAGGFGLPGAVRLACRAEDSFARQLGTLPDQTRQLILLAAAEPSGDRTLVWRAAARLSLPVQAAGPAVEAGLVDFGSLIRFWHPLARSAAYRSASLPERRQVHAALAEVTDPAASPDRRAWHRAQAAVGPDEDAAIGLEGSAEQAQVRGGLAAAAAFLRHAVLLRPTRRGTSAASWRQRRPACTPVPSARLWNC